MDFHDLVSLVCLVNLVDIEFIGLNTLGTFIELFIIVAILLMKSSSLFQVQFP